jgi:lysophospholipase L1-like esterase
VKTKSEKAKTRKETSNMKNLNPLTKLTLLFAVLLTFGTAQAQAVHYYVALGDSLARSAQPNGDYQHGYAEQLLANLQQQDPSLQLVKLACGGASTWDMIYGSSDPSCAFPHKTQLAEAVAFLRAHRQFVSLVTIDIGANDGPGDCIARLDQACLDAALPPISTNLATILSALRQAAGPDVPIVGMNYYDPYLVFWFSDPAAAQITEQMVVQFNDVLESVYGAAGDPVADVETAFSTTDWTLVNGIPLNVERICEWTWMCIPPPLGPDIHLNTAGYGVTAQAFLDALP